ncbi:Multidrug/solvent efflux pump periplasmic linker protein MepA [bioreactor metagenome]|uniref:Multidrug/solvent efflux pump periplasmic linker protein MepA n=2 Tax=root TaxID=1 RepID=A0A644X3H4_9ZZZZ|nr:efflux RND transporter periplasmic adaptor subunit [Aminivibrio sp.]MDD3515719.1 efflux RND transporter periplasmic adaptor subunit [Synergistaceae bacterium]MEA4951385.1 efflux RND transporter periplasmic adaptor subunit [Aminivibrio sp.]
MVVRVQAKLQEAAANTAAMEQKEEVPVPVDVMRLSRQDWEIWRSYYGQAKAGKSQTVTSYVKEIVREVHVQIGDRVKEGQVLLTLSSQDYRASAAADRVSYEDAVRDYKRLSELHKSGGVSKAQVEQAFSRMKSEEAKLQSSRSTLARTQIRASIDGIVASRSVEPGEVASDGKALLTIIDLKDLEAEIMVSRKDILSLNKDTPVEVLSDGQKTKCSIKRISPEAAPGSGLYPVVVCLNGLDVLPGTHVEARFLVDKKKDLIIIPSEIVQRRGDKAYVYVVDSERAKLREIVPGEGQNGSVSIENGLSEGDLVVVRGHNLLFENALVALTGEAAAGTAGK